MPAAAVSTPASPRRSTQSLDRAHAPQGRLPFRESLGNLASCLKKRFLLILRYGNTIIRLVHLIVVHVRIFFVLVLISIIRCGCHCICSSIYLPPGSAMQQARRSAARAKMDAARWCEASQVFSWPRRAGHKAAVVAMAQMVDTIKVNLT